MSLSLEGTFSGPDGARRLVEEVPLLNRSELQAFFPNATIIAEGFCGFVKSWTAVSGFN